ncbi:MAG: BolA family transcriptional regulator [Magnetospirillum sp.]|nr:BolA family transcriptional regulator [Magnetospirillum sp.]
MQVRTSIEQKLNQGLSPTHLDVIDDSGRHVGHAGHKPGGETHFRVEIVSAAFAGKSRLERHRLVNALLAEELAGPVHALQLATLTPEEAAG